MTISQDELRQLILGLAAILGALLLLLTRLAELYKFLKPFFGPIIHWGSILIPHGFIIWYWMYLAAINSSRIREGQVFVWLIIQLTLLTSLYTFIWSKWIYPKLSLWLKSQSQKRNEIPSSENSKQ